MLADLLGRKIDLRSSKWAVPTVGAHRDAPSLLPGGGRLIKTHEPYRSAYQRAIYLVRDPRDVAVSLWNMRRAAGFPAQALDEFLTNFASHGIGGWGSWQDHVSGWCSAHHAGATVLVVRYEELVYDTVTTLAQMLTFLHMEPPCDRLSEVAAAYSFDSVRGAGTGTRHAATLRTTRDRSRTGLSFEQQALFSPIMSFMQKMGYELDQPSPSRT